MVDARLRELAAARAVWQCWSGGGSLELRRWRWGRGRARAPRALGFTRALMNPTTRGRVVAGGGGEAVGVGEP